MNNEIQTKPERHWKAFGGYKYKREGYYRRGELMREIERRFGVRVPRWRWEHWRNVGLIPEGDMYGPGVKKGTTSIRRVYSDQLAEQVMGEIGVLIKEGKVTVD